MKFTEEKLENAIIKLLGEQSYPHVPGASLVREPQYVSREIVVGSQYNLQRFYSWCLL